eukprot:jgi/Picre1/29171/NNA_004564.t1
MKSSAMHPRARAPGLSGVVKSLGGHRTSARIRIIHTPFVGTRTKPTGIEKICRAGPEDERMAELNKRESELWDRQVELYTSMSKNASTMYEGLQEAYNELREFHMAEKKMWLEREESLAKENQELRNTLMYVMSRMRSLEASDDTWIDGTAASGGIPEQASMDEEDVRPSSSSSIQDDFAAAFAAVENGDILKDDPLSFKGRVEDTSVLGDEDVSMRKLPPGRAGFYPGDEDIDDFISENPRKRAVDVSGMQWNPRVWLGRMATWVELLGEDLEHKQLFSSETVQVNVTHGSTTSSVKETHSHDEKIFKDGHIEIEDTDSVEVEEKVSTRRVASPPGSKELNICTRMVMPMGLDADVDGWSTVDTVNAHGTEDCFGQKLFESDPLMFESMGTHIGWNDDQEGAHLGFGVDLFHDTSGTCIEGDGMDPYAGELVDGQKVQPYDAPPLIQFPQQQEQPLLDGSSLHDARSGVDEQSDDSPRDSSFTRYEDRDGVKAVPVQGTGAPIARRPPSRRNRSVPKRLADGVVRLPSSSLSSSKSPAVKSASSDQISSSTVGKSTKVLKKKGPERKELSNRGTGSRFGMKTRGAKAIRATSARHESKGRPSFCELVSAGFMKPGEHKFSVGHAEVRASVGEDGAINYAGSRYRAVSKFALVVLRERNRRGNRVMVGRKYHGMERSLMCFALVQILPSCRMLRLAILHKENLKKVHLTMTIAVNITSVIDEITFWVH